MRQKKQNYQKIQTRRISSKHAKNEIHIQKAIRNNQMNKKRDCEHFDSIHDIIVDSTKTNRFDDDDEKQNKNYVRNTFFIIFRNLHE